VPDLLERGMEQPRSLHEALADLRAAYERRPGAQLARMIEQLEAEIADREASRRRRKIALVV
jgi:hypothetical protein